MTGHTVLDMDSEKLPRISVDEPAASALPLPATPAQTRLAPHTEGDIQRTKFASVASREHITIDISEPAALHREASRQSAPSDGHLNMNYAFAGNTLKHRASALSAATAPPLNFRDLSAIYEVVSERRNSFDALLWNCPAIAFTAQSFLFSTGLDPDSTRMARIVTMLLSLIITIVVLQLFVRQLAAENADNNWLSDFEQRHGVAPEDCAHGENWRKYRHHKPPGAGFLGFLALHRAFPLWRNGLLCVGAAAIGVLVVTVFKIEWLENSNGGRCR